MLPNRVVRWMLVSLTLLLAFAPFATASAGGKPVRGPVPVNIYQANEYPGICGTFSVSMEATDFNVYYKAFTYGSTTRFIMTGAFKARFTNETTGKSIDVMLNAEATEVDNSDGSFIVTVHGPGVYHYLPDLPPLVYFRGNATTSFDAAGNPLHTQITGGNLQDLCAALAP